MNEVVKIDNAITDEIPPHTFSLQSGDLPIPTNQPAPYHMTPTSQEG